MPARRILVASPVEPSGGSWLLNCLLELGIKVGHKPIVDNVWRGSQPRPDANYIWIARDGGFELNPKAASLTTFLPILARQTRFSFRADVEVEYVQHFPARTSDDRSVVLIVRDPRDSLYSMYRRVAPSLSFAEFLRFPNPATLLDRPAHWAFFMACWLACPGVQIVRFEDYKRDAEATLRLALAALDLHDDDARIADALHQSSFEKAREAEARFRERVPGEHQVANRAGQVGEGRSRPEVQATIAEIEAAASPVLPRLGYDVPADTRRNQFEAARLSHEFLSIFDGIGVPAEIAETPLDMAASERALFSLLALAHRLDDDLIARAALLPDEARMLCDSLAELSGNYRERLAARLGATRARHSDGSDYFFRRIKEMRKARARGAVKDAPP